MRWKTTLFLLVLTVGVGAYISLYEIKQPNPERLKELSKRLVNISRKDVIRIETKTPDSSLELARSNELWRLTEPIKARADKALVDQILYSITSASATRILSVSADKPFDLNAYGLSPYVGTLTLDTKESSTTLFFGEQTAVSKNRYLKVGRRPEIFIVSGRYFDTINQPLERFRDPVLAHINSISTRRMELVSPNAQWALERQDNIWRLVEPVDDIASRNKVESLLRRLAGVRIRRFFDKEPTDKELSAWGIDNPRVRLIITAKDENKAPLTLSFGKALDKAKDKEKSKSEDAAEEKPLIWAKRNDEPTFYAVNKSDVDALLKQPESLREQSCFKFFAGKARKVELARAASGWAIEKTNGQWREIGSESSLDADKTQKFLTRIAGLRLSGFVAKLPDEAPQDFLDRYGFGEVGISVWTQGESAPQRLLIGSRSPMEKPKGYYGLIEGRPWILILPKDATELLETPIDSLRP